MFVVITPEGSVYTRSPDLVIVAPGYRCLPEVRPDHDPATQRVMQPVEPIPEEAEAYAWTVEDMPQPPPPTLDERRAALKAMLAQHRWEVECGGITLAGRLVRTDDRSKLLLSGKCRAAERQPDATHRWKGADGAEVALTSVEVIAMWDAVEAHVQACFDRELDLSAVIDAAEDADALAAIDITAGWPGRA